MKSATMSFVCALGALTSLVMWTPAAHAQTDALTLVKDGESQAPIVVVEDAPPMTRQAADELATYIEKISGARPDVLEGTPEPLPAPAIWVGYQPVLDDLFAELDFDFAHPEQILIAANADHLVLAGRDRWAESWNPHEDVIHSRGGRVTVEGVQQEYGTANAVYTFLQKHLDVRWLWPGETGTDIIEHQTIAFEPFVYRYHPQIRGRDTILRFAARTWSKRPHSGAWARHSRLQLDSLNASGGHAFNDWWERFHETNPDYFALQPDGTRSAFPTAHNVKICQSNPAVWEQWVDDVERELKENPNQRVFNASPNDSYNSGICICENCRAWDHPNGAPATYRWEGLGQRYVAMTDRHITFANRLGAKLKERFPGKDYYVMMHAYGHARPAPVEAAPDDNVLMSSVHNFHLRDDAQRERNLAMFKAWPELPQFIWRPNLGDGAAGWKSGLPGISLTEAIDDYRLIAEENCVGIFYDSAWQHWATQGPYYYMVGQLAWNPRCNARAVLADYYQRGFGPAAERIEAYWQLMERTHRKAASDASVASKPGQRGGYPQIYTDAVLAEAAAHLDAAAAQVAEGPGKYRDRIAFLRVGLEYTKLVTRRQALKQRQSAQAGQDADIVKQINAVQQQLETLARENPEGIAINWRRVGLRLD